MVASCASAARRRQWAAEGHRGLTAKSKPGLASRMGMLVDVPHETPGAIGTPRGHRAVRCGSPAIRAADPGTPPDLLHRDWPTWEVLRLRHTYLVIEHAGGNKSQAAIMLGIDRRTLTRFFERDRKAKVTGKPATPSR